MASERFQRQIDRLLEEAGWWEPELVFKMYYHVTLEGRRQIVFFRNMKTRGWYDMTGP